MGLDDLPQSLASEHRERIAEMRRIALTTFAPIAEEGPRGRVNRTLLKELGRTGVLPLIFPKVLGGESTAEISATTLCSVREGLAGGSTAAETALALQGLGAYPILQSGVPELKEQWIPPVASGEAVAAFALTEPDAGSDAAALALRADRVEGGYRLTGTKKWISNAPDADIYTVFARTGPEAGTRGITAFAVPGGTEGVGGAPLTLLAPHVMGTLELNEVFVPDDHVLGDVGRGFGVAMATLDLFRPSVGAFAVGMAQAALEAGVKHAGVRESFGKPLRDLQAVSHPLAEAAARVKAARLLVYDAAALYDSGERVTKAAAIAKLYATETAQFVIDTALQIHGAQGLEEGHLLAHLYREVRATRIYEGTSEIQREVIARELYR